MDGLVKKTVGKVEETAVASAGMPRRAMRNIALLAICQALTQSSNTLMFASSALAVLTIVSPDMRMWANLPITMQHFGVMLSVFPASMLMMRRGRKFGFRSGSAMGMVGASLAAIGLGMGSFPVMCVGGLFLGYVLRLLRDGTTGGFPGSVGDGTSVPDQRSLGMHDQKAGHRQVRGSDLFLSELEALHIGDMESAAINHVQPHRGQRAWAT